MKKINEFVFNTNFVLPTSAICISRRNSGKSYIIRELLERIQPSLVIILCPTDKFNGFWSNLKVKCKEVFTDYDKCKQYIEKIMSNQAILLKRNQKYNVVCVFDDCLELIDKTDKFLQQLWTTGRHMYITPILLSQKLTQINNAIRANSDYLFIKKVSATDTKLLFDDFISWIDNITFDLWKKFVNINIHDFRFIVVYNGYKNNFNEVLYVANAPQRENKISPVKINKTSVNIKKGNRQSSKIIVKT